MRRLLGALAARWTAEASSLSTREALAGLAISLAVLLGAIAGLLHPFTYPPGDVRGSPWFNAAVMAAFTLVGTAGVGIAVTALLGRRRR